MYIYIYLYLYGRKSACFKLTVVLLKLTVVLLKLTGVLRLQGATEQVYNMTSKIAIE